MWAHGWSLSGYVLSIPDGGLAGREDQYSASSSHTSFLHGSRLSQAKQGASPWALCGRLDQPVGRMLGSSGPSPIQASDGLWPGGCRGGGGLGGGPIQCPWWQSQELQESCPTCWDGGRTAGGRQTQVRRARTADGTATVAPDQEVLLLTCRKSPHVVQKYVFIQIFL